MSILGLITTEKLASERFKSIRRSVFYDYPNGASPLLGLLSLLDGESINDPEYSWYEKRLKELVSDTVNNTGTSGPWYADSTGAKGSAMATTAADRTAGTAYWLRVADLDVFTAHTIFRITNIAITGGTAEIFLKVNPHTDGSYQNTTGGNYVRVTPIHTVTAVTNADGVTYSAQVLGTANAQGQVGADEVVYNLPTSTGNALQIFRSKMKWANSAIKTALKFDETGPYKDKAKETSIQHMTTMELAFLFGTYSKSVVDDDTTYTTGGILFFMHLWEVGNGNTHAGVTSTYGNAAATVNSDDNKRIIDISGNITESALDDYYERLFRYTNNKSNEKMAFVGSGFLNVINKLYKSKVDLNVNVPHSDSYGMDVVKHVTPFGVVYYKTHPLFSRNALLRSNALFLDVHNLRYNYLDGRDTDIKEHTEPNDADFRQDEYLTEAGLEMQFPEANMYMTGVTGIA